MSRKRPLFAANWKMHKTPTQARDYVHSFWAAAEALVSRADIVLAVPFVDVESVRAELVHSTVALGAQDCYWENEGAFTGQVNAAMLKDAGVSYCIVGHSERRRLFGDTDKTVALKVDALLAADITPIVCVGETLEENQKGRTRARVLAQVQAGLGHLSDAARAALIIAYEPIWAIGTGLSDNPETANATIRVIREAAGGLNDARILYGGSMKIDNAALFCAEPDIDGGLVGSASLEPKSFIQLISNGVKVFRPR